MIDYNLYKTTLLQAGTEKEIIPHSSVFLITDQAVNIKLAKSCKRFVNYFLQHFLLSTNCKTNFSRLFLLQLMHQMPKAQKMMKDNIQSTFSKVSNILFRCPFFTSLQICLQKQYRLSSSFHSCCSDECQECKNS